jgi:hypothetical protein
LFTKEGGVTGKINEKIPRMGDKIQLISARQYRNMENPRCDPAGSVSGPNHRLVHSLKIRVNQLKGTSDTLIDHLGQHFSIVVIAFWVKMVAIIFMTTVLMVGLVTAIEMPRLRSTLSSM